MARKYENKQVLYRRCSSYSKTMIYTIFCGISFILLDHGVNDSKIFISALCSSTPPKRLVQYIRYRRWPQGILWTNPCDWSGHWDYISTPVSFLVYLHTSLLNDAMKISHSNFTLVESCLLIIALWSLTTEPCLQLLVICFIYVFGYFACMYVCVLQVCSAPEDLKRASDPLEMESQMVGSCHVGAKNWNLVFRKNSQCFSLMSIVLLLRLFQLVFCCCGKHCDPKQLGEERGSVYLILQFESIIKGRQDRNSRQELKAETTEEGYSLACFHWAAWLPFLYSPGVPAQGWYCPHCTVLHQLTIKKMSQDMPTDQWDGGNFSIELHFQLTKEAT